MRTVACEHCGRGRAHSIAGSSAHRAHARDQWRFGRREAGYEHTGQQRAHGLHLLGREPARHRRQLVAAQLRVVRLETVVWLGLGAVVRARRLDDRGALRKGTHHKLR